MTDEQLFRRFQDGDDSALGELAGRYETALLGLACGLLSGRRDLACDAVQDAWLRVIRYRSSFRGDSSFRTWLYRVTVNACRTLQQRRSRHNERHQAFAESGQIRSDSDFPPPSPDDPATLRAAVDRLGSAQRELILLCYPRDLTLAQVADVLEIPLGTVKSRLNAALKDLRTRLNREVAT